MGRRHQRTNRTPEPAHEPAAAAAPPSDLWRAAFLEALRDTCNVRHACEAARVSRSWAYECRERDEGFRAAWNDAVEDACDLLEAEAWRRAMKGCEKPVYQRGELVGTVIEYSDTLHLALLRAHRPEKFRERIDNRHSGPDGGAIPIAVAWDLSRYTDEELEQLERLAQKGAPDALGDPG